MATKKLTPGRFVRRYREALEAARSGVKVSTWWGDTGKGEAELREWFIERLNAKINHNGGIDQPRGRKDCGEWFWMARRDARRAEDRNRSRIRIRRFETDVARRRLAHLEG